MSNISAQALIRISAVQDPSLRRALSGAVNESKRASKQVAKDSESAAKVAEQAQLRGARMQIRLAEANRKAAERSAKQTAKATEQAQLAGARRQIAIDSAKAREQKRIVDDLERYKLRAAEKGAALQIRIDQKRQQQLAREQKHAEMRQGAVRRVMTGAVVGAGVGLARAATGFAEGAAGTLGVQDPRDTILGAKAIREQLTRQLIAAGKDDSFVQDVIAQIDATAKRTVVPQAQIAGAVSKAQSRFSDPQFVLENMDFLAQAARAAGESVETIAEFGLTLKQVGKLDNAAAMRLIQAQFIQGAKGSIEVKDFATTFAPSIATFAQDVGASGEEELGQITALAQVLGQSLKNPAEVATSMERLGGRLKQASVQKMLRGVGVDIADEKTGKIDRSTGEIFQQLTSSKALKNPQVRQKIFSDLLGEGAASTLIAAEGRNAGLYNSISNADPAKGAELIARITGSLDKQALTDVDRMNIEAQSVTLTAKGDALVKALVSAARTRSDVATGSPLGFEMAGPTMDVIQGIGGGALVSALLSGRLMRGGNSLAGASTAVTEAEAALAKVTTAAGGASTGLGLLARGAGMLGAGFVGFQIGAWMRDTFMGGEGTFLNAGAAAHQLLNGSAKAGEGTRDIAFYREKAARLDAKRGRIAAGAGMSAERTPEFYNPAGAVGPEAKLLVEVQDKRVTVKSVRSTDMFVDISGTGQMSMQTP